ncbi:hypothetical protein BGZ46_000050 [Entomortierella lignicola]|nr:hypothetical protein BGZ46_000050 [Entomortierella lignicola]
MLENMPPGVFLTSADGIELFSSKLPFPSEPKPFTIIALAHPSSTWIGSTHGVYLLQDPNGRILEDRRLDPKDQSALLLKCQQFLHKPTLDVMQNTPNVIHALSSIDKQDVVYTDSCYYFDPQTAKVMANTYKDLHHQCDLEAWADILSFQDHSPQAPTSSTSHDPHIQGRQIVKQAFQDSAVELDVMVLNASKFYHLGTMQEFLEGAIIDSFFMSELHIQNQESGIARVGSSSSPDLKDPRGEKESSNLVTTAHIRPPVYIENSIISPSAFIQSHSIIVDSDIPSSAIVPKDTCIFTLQLQENEFVTFTFSVKDDMKKAIGANVTAETALQELKIFERVPLCVVLPSELSPPQDLTDSLSLWIAPVFEIARTKQESVLLALNRLNRIRCYLADGEGEANSASNQAILEEETASLTIVGWISLKVAARRAREY